MTERAVPSPVVLFVTSTAIWGSTWFAIKFQLRHVAPELSVAYRFAVAALLLAGYCLATRRSLRFRVRTHAFLALQGVLMFGLNYVGVYWAEQYATSGLVALLFSTIVFMNPIGAYWLFDTPLASRTLVAAVLGVTGIALLFLPEIAQSSRGDDTMLGIALGLGATVFASAGNFAAMRNQRDGVPVLTGAAWGMAYGALAAAAVAMLHGVAWTFDTSAAYLSSLAYLAVFGSVLAFASYLTLLRQVGPALASYVGVATPIVAMGVSTLFEGYRWTIIGAFGVALALLGNWLALKPVRSARAVGRPSPRRPS